MHFTSFLAALALGSTAFAHMEMSDPMPFRSKLNKKLGDKVDYSMTAPLGEGKGLCKGYQSDISDLTGAGAPTGSYKAGAQASLTIMGAAAHNGGSCQASLSYDQGKTFKVIHSWEGNCPLASGGKFDFTVPSDAKAGSAILAWTWFNKSGNREMYMNCASVTIEAGSGAAPAVAFDSRPDIFVANLGTDCKTVEGKNVKFPNPGPDVTGAGDEGGYTGSACGGSGSAPSGGNTQSPTTPNAPADSKTPPPVNNDTPSQAPVTGGCGGGAKCPENTCCSKYGFCGTTPDHCGEGCDASAGKCGSLKLIRGGSYY
ncbi:Plant lectins/antimicrobial peptide [Glarea lozoyensis ATCC 20868]|uniref:Plant lectins/antimicrobial peptide n=2 Tax=Glarea lozoyensis TaxID=101852 RepID=S3CHV1_GLAL2|nr:Plant lectins/antimicrobial peptide [Glarea lozoyensis ATCC 20868]EHK97268.1 putative Killer toxin subunits alpha/beta [Glarea lozoyensis 74030]EPE25430.1 Plant lectins/antimicrobial peptide [Glarea lozoyensis ATCC 20868]